MFQSFGRGNKIHKKPKGGNHSREGEGEEGDSWSEREGEGMFKKGNGEKNGCDWGRFIMWSLMRRNQ